MSVYIVVGGFFGDEGKGKVAQYLAYADKPTISARGGVGPNAGHVVKHKGRSFEFRHVPSAALTPHTSIKLFVGPGVLIDPEVLSIELDDLEEFDPRIRNRFHIDGNCVIVEKRHKKSEWDNGYLSKEIGSMRSGCGPANSDRAMRKRDIKLAKDIDELMPYVTEVSREINEAIDQKSDVLLEGTQGFGLSLFHGPYPFVTSKDTTASQIAADVGIGPTRVDEVVVVIKPYVTRAGMGPLDEYETPRVEEEEIRPGVAIGSKRRVGKFDWELARRALVTNGATQIALTNVDRFWEDNKGVKNFNDLTKETREFVERLEKELKVPVTLISNGPNIEDMIDLRDRN